MLKKVPAPCPLKQWSRTNWNLASDSSIPQLNLATRNTYSKQTAKRPPWVTFDNQLSSVPSCRHLPSLSEDSPMLGHWWLQDIKKADWCPRNTSSKVPQDLTAFEDCNLPTPSTWWGNHSCLLGTEELLTLYLRLKGFPAQIFLSYLDAEWSSSQHGR